MMIELKKQIEKEDDIVGFIDNHLRPLNLGFKVDKENSKTPAINTFLLIITKKGEYWAKIIISKEYLLEKSFDETQRDLLDGNFVEAIRNRSCTYASDFDGFKAVN